jgi:O-antigen/teichoic acid export membrane protein
MSTLSGTRTSNYLLQIKGAVFYRIAAMLASFLAIPLMIRFLGQEKFGVWSTLLTALYWMIFFDLGIGNGLKNRVAESLAKGKTIRAKAFITSGYSIIGAIAAVLWVITFVAAYFIPWQVVFNTTAVSEVTLRHTVQVISFFIMLNFFVGIITSLLGAVQKTSLISLGQLITNVSVLILIFLFGMVGNISLLCLAMIYGTCLVGGNIILSFIYYRLYPYLLPKLGFDMGHVRPILQIGIQFFIIQLAALIIFTTDKMLITQLLGPEYVAQYDVVFRLFSVITLLHGLISTPLWSAYTEAYQNKDMNWMRGMMVRQLYIFLLVCLIACLCVFLAQPIIGLWIGKDFSVPFSLVFIMALFVIVSVWNSIFAILVNGIGKIKLQLYTAIAAMCLNIPLSIYFVKYCGFGSAGVVMGTTCSLLFAAVALPLQVWSILQKSK